MHGKRHLLVGFVGVFAMLAVPAVSAASIGTITVNSIDDTGGPGICVLRDAITSANSGQNTSGCSVSFIPPFLFAYQVVFNASLAGDIIKLTSPLPDLTNGTNLTITGPTSSSSGIIIDGNNSVHILEVDSGATLNLQRLTLQNGKVTQDSQPNGPVGGAIYNNGTLSIDNSRSSTTMRRDFPTLIMYGEVRSSMWVH